MTTIFFRLFFCLGALLALPLHAQINLNQRPSRVLGHPRLELKTGSPNLVEGRELSNPESIAVDTSSSPATLYVADSGNNRVLGWRNASSFSNGAKADLVIGQPDLLSTGRGGPGTAFSSGLFFPTALRTDAAGNLYVVDAGNNRILRFPRPVDRQDQLADLVIGQTSLNCSICAQPNSGGISARSIYTNGGNGLYAFGGALAFDAQGNLWFADSGNHRVLRYPQSALGSSPQNGPPADLVLGQTDFLSATQAQTDSGYVTPANPVRNRFYVPSGLAIDSSGRVYVSDQFRRVLVFAPPFQNGKDAARVMGAVTQPQCQPQTVTAGDTNFNGPEGVFIVAGDQSVGVADPRNHRIVLFDRFENWPQEGQTFSPRARGSSPLGQTDFCQIKSNRDQAEAGPNTLSSPAFGVVANGELFIADLGNNRVLVLPQSGQTQTAVRVLGQDGFNFSAINLIEGREFDFTRNTSSGLAADGGVQVDVNGATPYLYVADTYNNRVLGFRDVRRVRPGDKADLVIGQPDFQHNVINWPNNDADRPTNQSLFAPSGLAVDLDGNLYVADTGNGRVLRFPKPFAQAPGSRPTANLVLGQTSFTSKNTDPTQITMAQPYGLAFAQDNGLLVSDRLHNRVLLFGGKASGFSTGMAASKVFGQSDFRSLASGNTDSRLNIPTHIASDTDGRLYVADLANNRIQIFGPVNFQPDANSIAVQSLTLSAPGSGLNNPRGLYVSPVTGEIWLSDNSGRALRYPKFDDLVPAQVATFGLGLPTTPIALTQDAFGNLIYADTANRVAFHYAGFSYLTNGANFLVGRALAPGMIASAFRQTVGNPWADQDNAASTVPLPVTLSDLQLLVNDKPAPLYYVGKDQVNFLVPSDTPTNIQAEMQLVRLSTGQIVAASSVDTNTVSPALFTAGDGTGQLIAQNAEDDGRLTVNSSQNPISRNKVLVLYGTGQGLVPGQPPDGSPATEAASTPDKPRVAVNSRFLDDVDVLYSGLAPGLIGVWQLNIKIPDWVPPGNQILVGIQLRSVNSTGVQQPPRCTQGPTACQQRTWIAVKQ